VFESHVLTKHETDTLVKIMRRM